MSVRLIAMKCPACGADINVESTREFSFCTYCGTKILMNNENEHIYRSIDEARIKEAETERMILMRQMDMEEKSSISKKYLIALWIIGTAVLIIMGVIGFSIDNAGLGMCMMLGMCLGMWGGIGLFGNNDKKKKKRYVGPDSASISESMECYQDKNFNSVVLLYKGAGFTNVTAIPLNDLTVFNQRKNGQVETVTINGSDEFEEGDIFPKNSNVLITYHSK
ncbi:hypothetical protein [Lacrimispora saccharolytica]|uniref:hypothetical protein n=1 Tax=Lacrimispora saccharolytica TaxID=84030 RepID=UPI00265D38E5|nr:hypothetical protein [Lacrimispora saccharolytica]MCF2655995.1 hypothetical protein [Lacrimispora saccharolytica]